LRCWHINHLLASQFPRILLEVFDLLIDDWNFVLGYRFHMVLFAMSFVFRIVNCRCQRVRQHVGLTDVDGLPVFSSQQVISIQHLVQLVTELQRLFDSLEVVFNVLQALHLFDELVNILWIVPQFMSLLVHPPRALFDSVLH
jgi:hypothetical protein